MSVIEARDTRLAIDSQVFRACMANVSQLQPALAPQVQTSSSQAPEKDADFLALRLVNKRARLRLSPEPLDLASFPAKASLFAIVNSKGWFAAVTRDDAAASALVLSPLTDLRSSLTTASTENEQSFRPQRRVPISGSLPHILTFACNDTRLLLGLVDGSIHVYASDQLFSSDEGPVQPIHVFTVSASPALLSIRPNPGDIPELIAVLRDCTNSPGSLAVELLDVQKLVSSGGWMAGKSPSTTPTSISWSPKGKQLAIGLQSGDIVTFSPTATATPKSSIPHPPSVNNMSLISVHWLSTTSFHTIYAPPGRLTPDMDQIHFHASLDSKSNSVQDIRFNNPYLPFPGLRPPGEFLICLRGWDPSRVLLFIGDSTSSDIGLIGSVASDSGEIWHNLSLEETSTPSLPLDKDQNDTILLGMDVDLTSTEFYHHSTASGEALELPAHPIMYAYASDGTILGWHVLNVTGAPYPGMITVETRLTSAPSVPSSMVRELSSDMQMTPTISPTTSTPMETSVTKSPSTVFGQPSSFSAQSSGFGTSGSVFGQPSAFGQAQPVFSQQSTSVFGKPTSLGQPATTPAFGSTTAPSVFGQASTPAFSSTTSSGGFGAFSSAGPAKFGQTSFAFAGPPPTTSVPPASTTVPEESMDSDDAPTFGGLGLGTANSEESDSKPSIFGKSSDPVSSGTQSTNSGLVKPGAGFGAFAGFDQKSPFAKPSGFTTQQSTTTFATNVFQSKTASTSSTSPFGTPPSFGQSAFSQVTSTPAFGQSSFGQFQTGASAFGKSSFGAVSSAAPSVAATSSTDVTTGGAFSAFASGTQSAFSVAASKNTSTKPVWAATSDSTKPAESSSIGTATNANAFTKFAELPAAKVSSTSQFVARDSIARDDDSRSPSPAQAQQKEAASVFSTSTPGPSVGAFSNLQTTPSAFVKPASGFFGELPKDSPFFAPPKTLGTKSASVFALSVTPSSTPPKANSAQPTFGSTSMPGGVFKSAFSPTTATPAQPPPVSAFNAFSNGGGSFAAFSSGGSKSFSDLLRSSGEDKSSEAKTSEAEPSEATPTKPAQPSSQPSISATSVSTPAKEPPKPPSPPSEPPNVENKVPESVEVKTTEVSVERKEQVIVVQEPSLESISTSTSSSFVEVEEEEGEIEETAEAEQGDTDSFLSDVSSESEVSEEEESEVVSEASQEEKEERVERESEPRDVTLPVTPAHTRSPSTTPKAEHPKITVSVSPPPQTSSASSVPRVSPVQELSPMPPASPINEVPSASVQVQLPPPKASPAPSLPFSLTPRSNNRPIRSSPLANTSVVLDGEAEKPLPIGVTAPPTTVMQPAAPKVPFGQWTPPPPAQSVETDLFRPKIPASSSPFSVSGERSAPVTTNIFTSTTPPPPADKVAPTTTPGPSGVPFTLPTSLPTFAPSTAMPSPWGTPLRPTEVGAPMTKAAQTIFSGQPGLFKLGTTTPPSSSPSLFASPIPTMVPSPSPSPTPPLPKTQVPAPTPSPSPEQGMQAECTVLLSTLCKELDNLKQLATATSVKSADLQKRSGVSHEKADLGDPRKWAFGDAEEYGKVLVDVQVDVRGLKLERVSLRKALKELDSNILKVNTRKEEIARFNKAKTDAEFAKMLKIRTLAPEYSETQSQLRKSIRTIKDRVQKLEDHLQASKKRINELRTGRPSIRPPSLDTVNRTFRNIDIAIDQQKQDISQLRHRITKLEISKNVGAQDQLILSTSKRPLNVTPNVAITTAAALNAERSAQRLKKALLSSRTQPLLNTTVAASPLPASFQTPQKAAVKPDVKTPDVKTPEGVAFTLPSTAMMSFPSSLPWTPPPSSSPEFGTHDISPSRNRGGTKHHQKPIVLKKTPSPGGQTAITGMQSSTFEWKPVEPVRPASSLPFSLRPTGS